VQQAAETPSSPHLVAIQHPLWSQSVCNIGTCLGLNSSALEALLAAAPAYGHVEADEYRHVRLRGFYARQLLPDDATADLLLPQAQRGRRVMRSSLEEVFRLQSRSALISFDTSMISYRVLAWSATSQGRALFLPGLGKFNVRDAHTMHWEAAMEAAAAESLASIPPSQSPFHALLPTPFELQRTAYLKRDFANVRGAEARDRIVRLLGCAATSRLQGQGAGREFAPRYLIRFRGSFDDDEFANRLDELSAPGRYMAERDELRRIPGAAELPPRVLFARLDELRAAELAARRSILHFAWLERAPVLSAGRYTLRVPRSSEEVCAIGDAMKNCAGDRRYADAIMARRCVLVALYDLQADPECCCALGLGELDPANPSAWTQLSGYRNQPLPDEIRAVFEACRPELAGWLMDESLGRGGVE